ncbi:MAG: Rpn family recombination-promoting nuclease/putative transposase [Selenomonadaceae bacterium]|nr:Rpn family recombination-promoting nuclease/putative transposase [Selenomonadaceae bacterium]
MSKKYKDGLFRDYFSDKNRLLELCNALLQTDGKNPDEIVVNTLDGVFFGNLKNDLSCVYKNNFLVMIEHQSTPNENMPLRMLFYVAELLKQHIESFKEKIYQLKQIELPTPKFYLFYNGRKNEPEQRQMKLSTAFKDFSGLELIVNVYNLNEGNNEDFLKRSKSLKSYCIFVNRVEKNLREGMILEKAINEAINYCINADIMAEYLKTRRKEVVSMLGFEYDENLARKARDDEVREETREESKIEMVKNLLFAKTPLKYIVAATGWNEEKILEFAEKH